MDIEWKEGAVCFADGEQWDSRQLKSYGLGNALNNKDFQLNTIKQGDCISASELDTEDKYNLAVEAFGLFGFELGFNIDYISANSYPCMFVTHSDGIGFCDKGSEFLREKITFNQLMAIGELKRFIDRREKRSEVNEFMQAVIKDAIDIEGKGVAPIFNVSSSVSKVNRDIERNQPKNKSKQAYAILESLDYEYDLVKQRWFKKEWV